MTVQRISKRNIGREDQRLWHGRRVDKDLQDEWLVRLNGLFCMDLVSICQGHSPRDARRGSRPHLNLRFKSEYGQNMESRSDLKRLRGIWGQHLPSGVCMEIQSRMIFRSEDSLRHDVLVRLWQRREGDDSMDAWFNNIIPAVEAADSDVAGQLGKEAVKQTETNGETDWVIRSVGNRPAMRTIISRDALESLGSRTLYYPCAGEDVATPLTMFAPYVNQFWFVDIDYFNRHHPADQVPKLVSHPDWKLEDVHIQGPVSACMESRKDHSTGRSYNWLEPCTRTEVYSFQGETIHIHRRRGFGYQSLFGPSTLPTDIGKLGVFFYRRDSFEGGTRQTWMSPRKCCVGGGKRTRILQDVLGKFADPALLVTDGSNQLRVGSTVYRTLSMFSQKGRPSLDRIRQGIGFDDPEGRHFQCVGHAGMGYGPTLAWQITRKGH